MVVRTCVQWASGMGLELRRQLGYFVRASSVMARDPVAGVERVRGRLDRRRDAAAVKAMGLSVDDLYPIDVEWQRRLHVALECPWPCECESVARALYAEIMAGFAAMGLPERYQGWCDGGDRVHARSVDPRDSPTSRERRRDRRGARCHIAHGSGGSQAETPASRSNTRGTSFAPAAHCLSTTSTDTSPFTTSRQPIHDGPWSPPTQTGATASGSH